MDWMTLFFERREIYHGMFKKKIHSQAVGVLISNIQVLIHTFDIVVVTKLNSTIKFNMYDINLHFRIHYTT